VFRAGLRNGLWRLRKDVAMADRDTDLERIKQLIDIMRDNDLVELQIEHDDDKIVLKRANPQQIVSGVPAIKPESYVTPVGPLTSEDTGQPSARVEENLVEIKSPIVGTFYATPSPDSESYVEVGSAVSAQTIVCIIEAMKVMNEIKAETEGTIVEILVTNGQAVEYGQVLFRVRPD
jgi:acetyl-CoA carboxylase biotin carboxyl carrier protein